MAFGATWQVYAFSTSTGATSSGVRILVEGATSLAFGGGTRTSGVLTAIQLNNVNTSLHVSTGYSSNQVTAVDPLAPNVAPMHIIGLPLNPSNIAAASASNFYLDNSASIRTFGAASPVNANTGIGFWFKYNDGATIQATEVTQCQVWVGTGAGCTGNTLGGKYYITELKQAGKSWAYATSNSKITLHTSASKGQHYWYLAIGYYATAVGFQNNNTIKISNTFQ